MARCFPRGAATAAAAVLACAVVACLLPAAAASNFTLPALPYATNVFETPGGPGIDNATMFLHWNR